MIDIAEKYNGQYSKQQFANAYGIERTKFHRWMKRAEETSGVIFLNGLVDLSPLQIKTIIELFGEPQNLKYLFIDENID